MKEAVILAGGFGTRLQSVVEDLPKPMAPINDKPFLEILLNYLAKQGFNHIILSVGYKYQSIQKHFGPLFKNMAIDYFVEDHPLGTGGAIKAALTLAKSEDVFIFNGDTFFDIPLDKFFDFHIKKGSLTIGLKEMENFDRYGTVSIAKDGRITGFGEKQYREKGYINGGIYLMKSNFFDSYPVEEKFSFEKDIMEQYFASRDFYGKVFNNYFIDIGIPEDYERAQTELKQFEH